MVDGVLLLTWISMNHTISRSGFFFARRPDLDFYSVFDKLNWESRITIVLRLDRISDSVSFPEYGSEYDTKIFDLLLWIGWMDGWLW